MEVAVCGPLPRSRLLGQPGVALGLLPLLLPALVRGRLLASEGRRAVGVSEHGMERSGKVVGEGAAVVFF